MSKRNEARKVDDALYAVKVRKGELYFDLHAMRFHLWRDGGITCAGSMVATPYNPTSYGFVCFDAVPGNPGISKMAVQSAYEAALELNRLQAFA